MPTIEAILQARQERIDRLHRCQAGRTTLLVIDMQRGFLDRGAALEVPEGRRIVPNLQKLVAVCRRRRVPVVFTQFVYSDAVPCLRGDPFGPEHLPVVEGTQRGIGCPSSSCLVGPGTPGGANSAEIIRELAPQAGELVVPAHTYDKFYGTPLDLALRSRQIGWLVVTGVVTDVCVNSTVLARSPDGQRERDAMERIHDKRRDGLGAADPETRAAGDGDVLRAAGPAWHVRSDNVEKMVRAKVRFLRLCLGQPA